MFSLLFLYWWKRQTFREEIAKTCVSNDYKCSGFLFLYFMIFFDRFWKWKFSWTTYGCGFATVAAAAASAKILSRNSGYSLHETIQGCSEILTNLMVVCSEISIMERRYGCGLTFRTELMTKLTIFLPTGAYFHTFLPKITNRGTRTTKNYEK